MFFAQYLPVNTCIWQEKHSKFTVIRGTVGQDLLNFSVHAALC